MSDTNSGSRFVEEPVATSTSAAVRRYLSNRAGERRKVSFPTVAKDLVPAIRAKGPFPAFASELLDGVEID